MFFQPAIRRLLLVCVVETGGEPPKNFTVRVNARIGEPKGLPHFFDDFSKRTTPMPIMRSLLVFILPCIPHTIHGWTTLPSVTRNHSSVTRRPTSLRSEPSSSILLAEESWRQYVPLAVSVFVIGDILLGSPIVNLILAPMKRQIKDSEQNTAGVAVVNPKERIDSEKVAQEALDKARNTLELRNYLEEQKTDWDRMEEMRKKMDQQMAEMDQQKKAD